MKKPIFNFLILALLVGFLASCGENIFSTAEPEPSLDNARTAEDFNRIISDSEAIIENEDSTPEEIEDAYVDLGISYLGLSEMNTLNLVEDLSRLSETEDGESANAYNLIEITASQDVLVNAADAFNLANAEACNIDTPDETSSCNALTEDALLNRAMANMFVVVSQVNQAFEVSSTGNVTPLQDDGWDSLNTLLAPLNSELVSGQEWTVLDYANQSIESFDALDTFTEEQIEDVNNVRDVATELEELRDVINDGGSYTIGSDTFTFTQTYDSDDAMNDSDDDELNAALEAIFKSINK